MALNICYVLSGDSHAGLHDSGVSSACGRLCGLDLPVDHAAGHLWYDHWPHHIRRLRDPTGCHTNRPGNLLPKPHSLWHHLACGINASGPQVNKVKKNRFQ